jgi:hypothetical protein
MKKALLLLLVIAAFFSCKSLPSPQDPADSLVIGGFTWDFPDGFFEAPSRTIANGITLGFVNLTTARQFKVKVTDGYFYFLCHGNDTYMLQYATYESPGGPKTYTIGYNLNLRIEGKPERIIYMGHLKILFANPEQVQAKEQPGVIQTTWRFRESYAIENHIKDVKSFLEENDREHKWRDYKILNLYEK